MALIAAGMGDGRRIGTHRWLRRLVTTLMAAVLVVPLGIPLPAAAAEDGDAAEEPLRPTEPGEVPELRTRTSRTVRLDDGRLRSSLFTAPVNYQGDDGRWRPVSTKLVDSTRPGYASQSEAGSTTALFKDRLTDGFVRLESSTAHVDFSLQGASPVAAKRGGSRMSYPQAVPGVDLTYDIVPEGVKETLVLAHAGVPTSYRFNVSSSAPLEAKQSVGGAWAFYAGGSPGASFVLGAPFAVDSAGVGRGDDNATIKVDKVASGFVVTLSVKAEWLHERGRVFPVYLDPTIEAAPSSADADWGLSCPTCPGFQASDLWVGTTDDSPWRAGFQFDIGGLPAGADITNAQLELYYDKSCLEAGLLNVACGGEDHVLDAHAMTRAWSPQTVAGDLKFEPNATASKTLAVTDFPTAQWLGWNVTGLTKAWYLHEKENNGLLLKRRSETLGKSGPKFPSRRYTDATLRPKLTVTHNESVSLSVPPTRRSNGADLVWSRYAGYSGEAFSHYEVHRHTFAGFTPSTDPRTGTLLARINDRERTTFSDTTAAAGRTFYYKVVVGKVGAAAASSNERRADLPIDLHAEKLLQSTGAAQAVQVTSVDGATSCANYGGATEMHVGASSAAVSRGLVRFDLRDIPVGAQVVKATMSLHHTAVGSDQTVSAHQVTGDWQEGAGAGTCTADGATWHDRRGGSVGWDSDGVDHRAAAVASVANSAGAAPAWDAFDVTAAAQGWVNGTAPNHGVMLRASDEGRGTAKSIAYVSDDETVNPLLRPKLELLYVDDSHARGPSVALTAPAGNTLVRGTGVVVAAEAYDDRRVERVEFYVNKTKIGTDYDRPYEVTWDSTLRDNTACTESSSSTTLTADTDIGRAESECGQPLDQLSAKAFDDVGNKGETLGVGVRIANASLKTAIQLPADGSTVKGVVPVSVDATADALKNTSITKVELLVDGAVVATHTGGPPYTFDWDTLNVDHTAYDGPHKLAVRAFDNVGQVAKHKITVTTANTAGTKYQASFAAPGLPSDLVYDPAATTQETHTVDVTVTNTSLLTWDGANTSLVADWYEVGGGYTSSAVTGGVAFGADVLAGESRTVQLEIAPPKLPKGADRGLYDLRIDVEEYIPAASTVLPDQLVLYARKGNKPKAQKSQVRTPAASELGLEKFFHYTGEDIGGGMQHLFNVFNGNSMLRLTPLSSSGVGLNSVLDLSYNSRERKSRSPVGSGFSATISGLVRLGEPLTIHPKTSGKHYVAFTDGDGTTHTFKGVERNGKLVWDEPAGVHLFLRRFSSTDPDRAWAITRPDRVTFFFDTDGWPTSVRDNNGNQITFVDQKSENADDDPGKPRMQVTKVIDAKNRAFNLAYYINDDDLGPHVSGQLKSVTDHSDSRLLFDYYHDGNLRRITQVGAATTRDGGKVTTTNRAWTFTYTTSDLSAPAILLAQNRVNPDPNTPNQSQAIYSVRDPRGKETLFKYEQPANSSNDGKLKTSTDRAGADTTYAYDNAAATTTVSGPQQRATRFTYDPQGRVTAIVNPKGERTQVAWTPANHVEKITEASGAFTTYAYDDNGYLSRTIDQEANTTDLTYEHVDARTSTDLTGDLDTVDSSLYWTPGRTVPHVSQLASKTAPEGIATTNVTDDYRYTFGYDARGNLETVTEPPVGSPPERPVTRYAYNGDGTVLRMTDAHANVTQYGSYDPSGQPLSITDPLSRTTRFTYDNDGLVKTVVDPRHATDASATPQANYRTVMTYDTLHRLVRQSAPKSSSTLPGALLYSGAAYDGNDNVTAQYQPHDSAAFTAAETTASSYDAMDRLTLVTGPDTSEDSEGERTKFEYDTAGRMIRQTAPKGITTPPADDYVTGYAYDPLDRLLRETRHHVLADGTVKPSSITHYCYDLAGDLVSVTAPNAGLSSRTCDAGEPRPSHTVVMAYDKAHRLTSREDAKLNKTTYGHDRNDNVTTVTDPEGNQTRVVFDQRDMPVERSEPFSDTRRVTTRMEYDKVGNLTRTVHPRGFDVAGGAAPFDRYTTTYTYDAADQLTRVTLPSSTPAGDTTDKRYVHRRYDANGYLRLTTRSTAVNDDSADLDAVPGEAKTRMTHFDPGWIRTSDDNLAGGDNDPQPKVSFDYTPEGWQAKRTPQAAEGDELTMTWAYFNDGQVRERKDEGGQASTYRYDMNNNLRRAVDAGEDGPATHPRVIVLEHDPLDRVAVSRERERPPDGVTSPKENFNTTRFGYDLNHNVTDRTENIVEKPDLTQLEPGRKHTFAYEPNDWLASHLDAGKNSADGAIDDDQRIVNTFDKVGRELRRVVQRRPGADAYEAKQTTEWTWFANGKLSTLKTSTSSAGVTESHTVGYVDSGVYVNGHRVTDEFMRSGPSVGACASTTCVAKYRYDARDRLVKEAPGHGPSTTYDLDAAGNVKEETTFADDTADDTGTVTKKTVMTYMGDQLDKVTVDADIPQRHHYDRRGNLSCVVLEKTQTSRGICDTASGKDLDRRVLAAYSYDYLDRMLTYRSYRSDGTTQQRDDRSSYVYDALDRTDTQREEHFDASGALTSARTTAYSYLGLTSMVSAETHTQGVEQTTGPEIRTRSYSYDTFGHRVAMTDDPAATGAETKSYTYGYDVHGSVSQLITDTGSVSAAYGYKAYGGPDEKLSGGDTDAEDPLNPYRYTGKRFDSGSGQIDMGARRFSPDTGRFIQRDQYHDALADLGLATDPLSGNRYALAAGNPLSFVEVDGHALDIPSGGGAAEGPKTTSNGELWGWAEPGSDRAKASTSHPRIPQQPTGSGSSPSGGGGGRSFDTPTNREGHQPYEGNPLNFFAFLNHATEQFFAAIDRLGPDPYPEHVAIGFPPLPFKPLRPKAAPSTTLGLGDEIGILREAARGKGNFGVGAATRAEAQTLGRSWVGEGYGVASDGKTLISRDGLRQFRPPSYKPSLDKWQANFEQRWPGVTEWQSNAHLNILDP